MLIERGTRLGPYEILSRIGAGGMGEVWQAKDTRLDRGVAIKILPAALAEDANFKLRFEREAKAISQLNHPNICTLYDVGDGYLVMELLEGESLADRLSRGPLPLAEVLKFGAQIAEALDRAHRSGIVHRDLKPGNVMLTRSGAKLLDFGLASVSGGLARGNGVLRTVEGTQATVARPLTQEGTILGTFQYMAPEQLEGEEADARTDIFALGAVLYEMTTGHRAFEGKTKTSLIAAIVSAAPRPLAETQPLTPPALEHVIERCLEKDPEERWQNARDIAEELRWIGEAGSQAGVAVPIVTRRRRTRTLITGTIAALAGALLASVGTWAYLNGHRRPLRFSIGTPDAIRMVQPAAGGGVGLSPDGRTLLFVGQDSSGTSRIYLRALDSFEPKPVPLTEGVSYPFWSPDGKAIAFFSGGKLKRVDLSGAPPVVIADAVDSRGGAWSSKGVIVYAASIASPLSVVSAAGGTPALLTEIGSGERGHRFPSFFPDGDHFLFYKQGSEQVQGIWLGSLSTKRTARLIDTRAAGIVAGATEILYVRDGLLLRQNVDLKAFSLDGTARPIAQGVGTSNDRNYLMLAATPSTVVFQSGGIDTATFTWFDRAGRNLGSVGPAGEYSEPSFGAREAKVVVAVPGDVRELDLTTGRLNRLGFEKEEYSTPASAPDGSHVVCYAVVNGKPALAELVPGKPRRIIGQYPKAFWPDYFDSTGEMMLIEGEGNDRRSDFDVFLARRSNGYKLEPLLASPLNESHAQLSPDSKFVAYSSDESGRAEVYVQPVPPTGERWAISNMGGDQGQWRGDGKEIVYLAPDGKLMSVPIVRTAPFEAGEPSVLFATRIPPASVLGNRNQYLIHPDGTKFLLLDPVESPHSNEVDVITDWKR